MVFLLWFWRLEVQNHGVGGTMLLLKVAGKKDLFQGYPLASRGLLTVLSFLGL